MTVSTFDCWPGKIVCGPGAVKNLGEIIQGMNQENVLVFTDNGMKRLPLIADTVGRLKDAGFTVNLFADIDPNPVTSTVSRAVDFMKKVKPQVLVCIGGGSPIDVAKVANVVYSHGGSADDYDIAIGGITKITPKLLPVIAVPTTAGTGTEATYVGVITDKERRTKFGVLSPLIIPDAAILDPEVTVTMPSGLTAFTGIDALTHCIESYTSVVGFPPADALAIQGVKMISRSLRTAVLDGQNLEAREDMLVASMMGGTSFSLNGLGVCHAMAHQLSAFFDVPHGLANAILLPRVMKFNLPAAPQKFADIAAAMGADTRGRSVDKAAELALELVERLAADVNIPRYLDETGASKNNIGELVERALADNPITTNPRPVTAYDIERLYMDSFR
jgi:alcohol dehydrogenase class IV